MSIKDELEGADFKVKVKRGKVRPVASSFNFFLNEKEMITLDKLAETKGLTKSLLMRQAFRLYQLIDKRLSAGERIYFSSDRGKIEVEIIL